MALQLQHPQLFIALLAVPLLVLLVWNLLYWKKQTAAKIGDEKLVAELTRSYSPRNFLIKVVLGGLALVAIIIAMLNPRKPGKMEDVERKGVDVMIALDVSNSMLADDVKPSRLEKARQLIYELLPSLRNDRIGLVVFAGRAYLQMPLTPDHSAVSMYVQNAGPLLVPTQGTMLSEALKLCASAFNSKDRKYKAVILITDGEDHDPESIAMAEQLAANGIMVNTVGIGSSKGSVFADPRTGQLKKDELGNLVVSRLNEEQLKQIAAITQGVYVNSENVGLTAAVIEKKLSGIEQTPMEDLSFMDFVNYFPLFALLAMVLLLTEMFFPERKFKMAAALVLVSTLLQAQHPDKLYRRGEYEEAAEAYGKMLSVKADPRAVFNQGNAWFRMKNFERAEQAYAGLLLTADDSLRQRAAYNAGVSFSRQNKLEESITAYKMALKLNPEDEDARINLQKALLQLKKRQPPPPKPDPQKQDEQQKNKQQPPPQNLDKKDIERYLKALQQREQQVQQKMQQSRKRNVMQPEKDW